MPFHQWGKAINSTRIDQPHFTLNDVRPRSIKKRIVRSDNLDNVEQFMNDGAMRHNNDRQIIIIIGKQYLVG